MVGYFLDAPTQKRLVEAFVAERCDLNLFPCLERITGPSLEDGGRASLGETRDAAEDAKTTGMLVFHPRAILKQESFWAPFIWFWVRASDGAMLVRESTLRCAEYVVKIVTDHTSKVHGVVTLPIPAGSAYEMEEYRPIVKKPAPPSLTLHWSSPEERFTSVYGTHRTGKIYYYVLLSVEHTDTHLLYAFHADTLRATCEQTAIDLHYRHPMIMLM